MLPPTSVSRASLISTNDLLVKMTKQVEDLVLVDNYDQNLAITISALSPSLNLESFSQLMKELEKDGLVELTGRTTKSNSGRSEREWQFVPVQRELL